MATKVRAFYVRMSNSEHKKMAKSERWPVPRLAQWDRNFLFREWHNTNSSLLSASQLKQKTLL